MHDTFKQTEEVSTVLVCAAEMPYALRSGLHLALLCLWVQYNPGDCKFHGSLLSAGCGVCHDIACLLLLSSSRHVKISCLVDSDGWFGSPCQTITQFTDL